MEAALIEAAHSEQIRFQKTLLRPTTQRPITIF